MQWPPSESEVRHFAAVRDGVDASAVAARIAHAMTVCGFVVDVQDENLSDYTEVRVAEGATRFDGDETYYDDAVVVLLSRVAPVAAIADSMWVATPTTQG